MPGLDVAFMLEILPKMLWAALITIQISLLTVLFSCIGGALFTSLRLLGTRPVQWLVIGFVEFTRGVPPLVQISMIYFLLPRIGLVLNEFWTGVAALSFVGIGYAVEIMRGAVLSLDKGQNESALALGLTRRQSLFLVLMPQALRRMIPPMTNELANIVKASALLSVISVNEITKVANDTIFETFVVIEVLIEMTILYLLIIGILTFASRKLEAATR